MKTSTKKALRQVATQASALAADMRQFADGRRPAAQPRAAAFAFDLMTLAKAVEHADQLRLPLSADQIAHVLEIALKSKLAVRALCEQEAAVDLGNGHHLVCAVREAGVPG